MDNLIAKLAEAFIPPRADPLPQRANHVPDRRRQEFSRTDNTRTERPERTTETPHKAGGEDQVSSDGKGERKDFNEVLAKKMSKRDNKPIKRELNVQDSEPEVADQAQPAVLVAEVKAPEKIVTEDIVQLNTPTTAQAKTEQPGVIDGLLEKAVLKNQANVTSGEEVVTPVDKIVGNANEAKTEAIGIPIKTLTSEVKAAKPEINPSETTEKLKTKTDQPVVKTDQPVLKTEQPVVKTDQPVLKTQQPVSKTLQPELKATQGGENLAAANKDIDLQQAEVSTKAGKLDQKPAIVQSENIPQTGIQNKFDKSIAKSKQDATTKVNTTSTPQASTETNNNTVLNPADITNKDLDKTFKHEMAFETKPETVTQFATDSSVKTSVGNSRLDIKPQNISSTVNQITEQIRSSSARGREQITIALDPPELGKVMIKFQQRNGEIVGIVEVEKARTQQEIADEMPVILKSLNEGGIAVKRVEVVLADQETQDALKDNSTNQNNNTGRQGFQDSSDNPQNQPSDPRPRNFSRQYNPGNKADNYTNTLSDDAINMFA
jgi:flagellar hook-length control protein FliK